MEHLWAGWRNAYVRGDDDGPVIDIAEGQTLFEAIVHSALPDEETLVVWRGERVFAVLNRYPYTSGHVMVLPNRGVQQLDELDDDEYAELWHGVRLATRAIQHAYQPHGINVGANLGRGAGARCGHGRCRPGRLPGCVRRAGTGDGRAGDSGRR